MATPVYKAGQTLKLSLDTGDSSVSSATTKSIFTKNPNGKVEQKTATVASSTKLEYTIPANEHIYGDWKAYTQGDFTGSVVKKGRTVSWKAVNNFE